MTELEPTREKKKDVPLARSLAVLRVSQGLTQAEWAEAAGVRASSVSSYELGKLTPSLRMVERLLAGLRLPLAALDSTSAFQNEIRAMRQVSEPSGEASGVLPGARGSALWTEVEALAVDLGRVASRVARLFFLLLSERRCDDWRG